MAIVDAGEGTFLDTDPVTAPEGTPGGHVYAYAHFVSLDRISYGLRRTAGGPLDREIESVKVGSYDIEDGVKEPIQVADQAIEFMLGGDEWEDAYYQLGGKE